MIPCFQVSFFQNFIPGYDHEVFSGSHIPIIFLQSEPPRAVKSYVFAKVLCNFGNFMSYGVKSKLYFFSPLPMCFSNDMKFLRTHPSRAE